MDEHTEDGGWPFHSYTLSFTVSRYFKSPFIILKIFLKNPILSLFYK